MSKLGKFEIQLVFDVGGAFYRVCTVKMSPKGDTYFLNHHPIIGGKTSNHPGGTTTSEVDLVGVRRTSKAAASRTLWRGVWNLNAYGGGSTLRDPGLHITALKKPEKNRIVEVVPWPRAPSRVWGVELWGFDADADAGELAAARATAPYPDCSIVASAETNRRNPGLLLTVWRADVEAPYEPILATNHVTGETFLRIPPRFDGTRFAMEHDEADLWLPRPLPREQYASEPWRAHPAYEFTRRSSPSRQL